jgi:hypothetical protein
MHRTCTILAGNVAFYSWPSLGCQSATDLQEELVEAVGRLTTAVLRRKGRFAFVGMFPHVFPTICWESMKLQCGGVTD